MHISIVTGDALDFQADVLALKYAQELYGVDLAVVQRLEENGIEVSSSLPSVGKFLFMDTRDSIAANVVLFMGVEPLDNFGYAEIRNFAREILVAISSHAPSTRHLCLTLHGAGYGLEETTVLEEEVNGLLDGLQDGHLPENLEQISIVEHNNYRATLIRRVLLEYVQQGIFIMHPTFGYLRVTA